MAYDDGIARTLQSAVAGLPLAPSDLLTERKMFGGHCVLLNGKMLAGVIGSQLVIGLNDSDFAEALALPYVRPMDFTGKPMRNFAYVDPEGFDTELDYMHWIQKS